MKRVLMLMVLAVCFFYKNAAAQSLEEINWITEEYAPYNYSENGVPKGIAVDILAEIWKKLSVHKDVKEIKVWPWARGYKAVQEKSGTCLFTMTVTDERLKLFKFVTPIVDSNISIIAKKSKGYKINSIEDLKKLKVGTVRDDIGEQLLVAAGFNIDQLDQTSSADLLVKKLDAGRDDVVSYGFDTVKYNMKLLGIDSSQYEIIHILKEGQMGFAFHQGTDPALLAAMQKALDEMAKDGTIAKIKDKYLQ